MNEMDDRLAGDPVWELFGPSHPGLVREASRTRSYGRWLVAAGLITLIWLRFPTIGVTAACLAVAAPDFRMGRRLARSIPSKSSGTICARFTYAWGAWKLGAAAFALMFVSVARFVLTGQVHEMPLFFAAASLLWMGGFSLSAALTALGLLEAYRSGMRVWIGEGVNQARTLLMGMLIVAFVFVVLVPWSISLVGLSPRANDSRVDLEGLLMLFGFFGCLFAGPVVILLILDWIGRRVIADRPGKLGPKVPAVGKWNS